jgi:hypothetical protein
MVKAGMSNNIYHKIILTIVVVVWSIKSIIDWLKDLFFIFI